MKEIVIAPSSSLNLLNFSEIWKFRELFYIFAWRDIKVRYKQTLIGIAWVVFQPIATTVLFTILFSRLFAISQTKLPYSLFVLSGLIFWNFFSNSLTHASNSLLENENIIKKVYFPKIILPLSSVATGLLDFSINLVIFLAIVIIFGFTPSILSFIVIPIGILITVITAGGLGLFLSSINVKYRDIKYILPFFIQLLLFMSPVIYPQSILPWQNKIIWSLNPMSGVIESTRIIISGSNQIDFLFLGTSFLFALIYFFLGLYIFKSTERFFADIA